ncbi:MAG: aminotransferase class IV [Syntrophobacteraceae bacterium]
MDAGNIILYPYFAEVNMSVPVLSFDQVIDRLLSIRQPYFAKYLAVYSSWYGGIITEPTLMMLPLDDHIVHRGDGVFEAIKCAGWNIYALARHLERMKCSLAASFLEQPVDDERLIEIVCATVRAGNIGNCIVRIFISRGPGSFSANPYESVGSQLYVVVTAHEPTSPEKYEKGVKLVTTDIPIKTNYFATIKNCNYLPNVLMKKKAVDGGADYSVSLDEKGFLAEGSTENIGIVSKKGELLIPRFSRTLRGVTVTRVMELARGLTGSQLTATAEADITPEQACDAAEILIFATSFNILPAVEYDGKMIGNGRPGPVFRRLLELMVEDQAKNREMLTAVEL